MSDWRQVALTELVAQRRDSMKIESGVEYRLLGVRWYGSGAFHRETVTRETSKATTVYRVTPGQFIYNRLFAGKGSFGLVPPEFAGAFVSNEFPLFDTDTDRLSAEYLNLYFQQRQVWDYVEAVSIGTTASRNRWKESQFLAHRIPLPPLPVQRRIVEIIAAVDDQITALDAEAEAATRVRGGLLDGFTGAASNDTKLLGELCPVIGSGPSWAAEDESSVPLEEAWTVLKITNTRPDGSIDLSELAYVVGLPARTKVIGPTSLVMIRTNGNRKRIGNVYLPPEEVHGAAVSAFQFILDAVDVETRDYLYLVLRSPRIQHQMSDSASGSTGLGNLAVRWLKTLEIPWPDAEMRELQVESVQAIDAKVTAIRAEADQLRSVRAGLLSGLLDRTIDIEPSELGV